MSKVPRLRFKEFSGEWEERPLEDIISIASGISPSNYSLNSDSGLPFVKVEDLNNCSKYQLNAREYSASSRNVIKSGSIIFPKRGAAILLNKIRISQCDILMDSNMMALTIKSENFSNEFLYYKILDEDLSKIADTSSIPQINNKHILPYKIFVPFVKEQQKIASFLSAVDTKIDQLTRKKELLEHYKKGVMQKIFSQELRFKADAPGRSLLPIGNSPSDGSEFPEWEEKILGDYLIHKSTKNKNNEVSLVLSVSNKKGFISQEEQFDGYEVASSDITTYKIVAKGDYAYNPSRINVGSIARLDKFDKGVVSPMYVVFGLKKDLHPLFFDNLYQTHRFKHAIKKACSGSVRDSLNFNDLADFDVLLPCYEEQTKIANFLTAIDTKIDFVAKQLDEAKNFKKGLLQQMFV